MADASVAQFVARGGFPFHPATTTVVVAVVTGDSYKCDNSTTENSKRCNNGAIILLRPQ